MEPPPSSVVVAGSRDESLYFSVSGLTDLSILTLSCVAFLFVLLPVMANKLHHYVIGEFPECTSDKIF